MHILEAIQLNIDHIAPLVPYFSYIIIFSITMLCFAFAIMMLKYIFGTGEIIAQIKKHNQILGGILIEMRNQNSREEIQKHDLEDIASELKLKKEHNVKNG